MQATLFAGNEKNSTDVLLSVLFRFPACAAQEKYFKVTLKYFRTCFLLLPIRLHIP